MPCAVCPQSRNAAPKEKISTIAERYAIMALAAANAARRERQPMKRGITIQERLKDLRTEQHLRLEELAQQTGISKSALGSYENDDYKEINHGNLVTAGEVLWRVNRLYPVPDGKQKSPKHRTYGAAFE